MVGDSYGAFAAYAAHGFERVSVMRPGLLEVKVADLPMQRYSPLNSSIGLKGWVNAEIVEFNPPPGNERQREAVTGLLKHSTRKSTKM